VATRRLRSDLRTFAPLLDEGWADGLRDELSWLADLLGGVRDLDVLAGRFADRIAALAPGDRAGAKGLVVRLERQDAAARATLAAGMTSDRYRALLDAVVRAAQSPPARKGTEGSKARDAFPALAAKPWRQLSRAVAQLSSPPADDDLHRVRIAAKRCRYAVEATEAVSGRAAARLAKRLAGLQGVLGDLHDAVVAEQWLRDTAKDLTPRQALSAGLMIGAEQADAARCRAHWRPAWDGVRAAAAEWRAER
jgi:CHAD domain-containing protein